jgi:1,4-dihydroxy-2-naphthoate octaprenyltransferase
MAIRPKTILASIGPVILGLAIAYFHKKNINSLIAILTISCAVTLQFITNLFNDFMDFKNGVDDDSRIGPTRVSAQGLLTSNEIKIALTMLTLFSLSMGFYLMYIGGYYITFIGLSSLIFSYGYTGGPYPLSYHGLGELSALIFFGILAVSGTAYLQTNVFNPQEFYFGFSTGAIAALILGVNNLRDMESDLKANKRTLAILIGKKLHKTLLFILAISPVIFNFIFALYFNKYLFLISIFPFVLYLKTLSKILTESASQNFNIYLGKTALYLFQYTISTSIIFYIYAKQS